MDKALNRQTIKQEHKRKSRWTRVVACLAAVTLFMTFYALILPAVTQEAKTYCGMEEHLEHSAECYDMELDKENPICGREIHEHTLQCYSDPDADVETAAMWENSFSNVVLSGIWSEDVIAIAKSQLGYTESSKNYQVQEDGITQNGYTRYGDWDGDAYGDWGAMFCSFCIHYANVDTSLIPLEAECQRWVDQLTERDLYSSAIDYTPKAGDLVFFNSDEGSGADHVGLVEELIYSAENEIESIKTIEGNSENSVRHQTYAADDSSILGYGRLPVNPEQPATLTPYTESELVPEGEPVVEKTMDLLNEPKQATTGSITIRHMQTGSADMSAHTFSLLFNPNASANATYSINGGEAVALTPNVRANIALHINDTIVISGLDFATYYPELKIKPYPTTYQCGGCLMTIDGGAPEGYNGMVYMTYNLSSENPDGTIDFLTTYEPQDECGDLELYVNYCDMASVPPYDVTVTVIPPPGRPNLNGKYGAAIFENNVGTVHFNGCSSINSSETTDVIALPEGYSYTVAMPQFEGYTLSRTLNGEATDPNITGTVHRCETGMANVFYYRESGAVGSLVVSKVVSGASAVAWDDFDFTVVLDDTSYNYTPKAGTSEEKTPMTFVNGVASFTLRAGQSKSGIQIPAGTNFTITEIAARRQVGANNTTIPFGSGGYTVKINGTVSANREFRGVITADMIQTVGYDNYMSNSDTPGITVMKTVSGTNIPNTDTVYNFTVTDANGNSATGKYKLNGNSYNSIPADGISLKAGQSALLFDLAAGVYSVTERLLTPAGYTNLVSTTYRLDSSDSTEGRTASVSVVDSTASHTLTFNNEYGTPPPRGSLTLSKTITGDGSCPGDIFNFVVTLTPPAGQEILTGAYGDMTFTANPDNTASVARIPLKGGESATASEIPVGYSYIVTEEEANLNGYTTVSEGATGVIVADTVSAVNFTNDKPSAAKLDITKAVSGSETPSADTLYTFTVINNATGAPATGKYQIDDGVLADIPATGQIQLKAGETAHLTELARENHTVTESAPTGAAATDYISTSYVLSDPSAEGAAQTVTGDGVTVTTLARTKTTTHITFTNTYAGYSSDIQITKTAYGSGDPDETFTFTMTFKNAWGNPLQIPADTETPARYTVSGTSPYAVTFTLKNGEFVTLKDIMTDDTEVTLTETSSSNYRVKITDTTNNTVLSQTNTATFRLSPDLTVTPPLLEILVENDKGEKFRKIDAAAYEEDGTEVGLDGAEFIVYYCAAVHTHSATVDEENSCWERIDGVYGSSTLESTAGMGRLPIDATGTYLIYETKAPTGYHRPTGGLLVTYNTATDTMTAAPFGTDPLVAVVSGSTLLIKNELTEEVFILPETGGTGTLPYVLIGAGLLLISILFSAYLYHKNNERRFRE